MEDYARLQRRLILATLIVSLATSLFTLLWFGPLVARSLFLGSLAGLLYLRLLARSVAQLGNGSYRIGRFQLAIPVMLIVTAARLPQLSLLPTFLGFLLYKPALIIQAIVDA